LDQAACHVAQQPSAGVWPFWDVGAAAPSSLSFEAATGASSVCGRCIEVQCEDAQARHSAHRERARRRCRPSSSARPPLPWPFPRASRRAATRPPVATQPSNQPLPARRSTAQGRCVRKGDSVVVTLQAVCSGCAPGTVALHPLAMMKLAKNTSTALPVRYRQVPPRMARSAAAPDVGGSLRELARAAAAAQHGAAACRTPWRAAPAAAHCDSRHLLPAGGVHPPRKPRGGRFGVQQYHAAPAGGPGRRVGSAARSVGPHRSAALRRGAAAQRALGGDSPAAHGAACAKPSVGARLPPARPATAATRRALLAVRALSVPLRPQAGAAWAPMEHVGGAAWQLADPPPAPLDLLLYSDMGESVLAR
jgi:hypothetical protein